MDSIKPIDAIDTAAEDMIGTLDDQLDDLALAAETSYARRQRFALVVDATSSMGPVWNMAKDSLKYAVDEIKKRSNVPVQLTVIAYRDHIDDPADIVTEQSEWSDDTDYLKEFISNIKAKGGGDYPESIGHGLRLLEQSPVNQVILIGDAPGKEGSDGFKEARWLGTQKAPIYAMYTNDESLVVESFRKLASLSGGKAFYLKNKESMADIFMLLLASNKALAIEYQPTTIEGKAMQAELSK